MVGEATEIIAHFDLDSFFVSVETRENPNLRGHPVAVAYSNENLTRGVVLSASYEARKLGVRSGMPVHQAKEKCPELEIIPPRHGYYSQVSKDVFEEIRLLGYEWKQASIDEGYLRLTSAFSWDEIEELTAFGLDFQNRISSELQLPITIGICSTRMLAKMASTISKPKGVGVIAPSNIIKAFKSYPTQIIPGIGRKAFASLKEQGIYTIQHALSDYPPSNKLVDFIQRVIYQRTPPWFGNSRRRKSIGRNRTIRAKKEEMDRARAELHRLVSLATQRLKKENLETRTITVIIRDGSYKTKSKALSLKHPSQDYDVLEKIADELFFSLCPCPIDIRLVGIRFSNLETIDPHQSKITQFLF